MNAPDGAPDEADVSFTDQPSETVPVTDQAAEDGSTRQDSPPRGSTGPTTVREDLGTLADEGRRLLAAVETRFVVPLVESYPDVARHLGSAGREFAAAYRAVVHGQEKEWRGPGGRDSRQEKITVERVDSVEPPGSGTTED